MRLLRRELVIGLDALVSHRRVLSQLVGCAGLLDTGGFAVPFVSLGTVSRDRYGRNMTSTVTAGIDLSADERKTGVATIDWPHREHAVVTALSVGKHTDQDLCDLIKNVDKTGIDCPLGWPSLFIDYLVAHRAGAELLVPESRRTLRFRATDLHVIETTGVQPLSVSADRIASAAMRCAKIQSMLVHEGVAVDRTGRTGAIVEVYPAASLRMWRLGGNGYKGREGRGARAELVEAIAREVPYLDLGGYAEACLSSDDALDAVICALVAGLTHWNGSADIPGEALYAAESEGWIALPMTARQLFRLRMQGGPTESFTTVAQADAAIAQHESALLKARLNFALDEDVVPSDEELRAAERAPTDD